MDAGTEGRGEPTSAAGSGVGKPVIAVFNSSSDTVELLRTALEEHGFHTIVGHIGHASQRHHLDKAHLPAVL